MHSTLLWRPRLRYCPSPLLAQDPDQVGWLVGWFVGWLVSWLVGWLVALIAVHRGVMNNVG